jgi:hypothetical protein
VQQETVRIKPYKAERERKTKREERQEEKK